MGVADVFEVRSVPELLVENSLRHADKVAFADDRSAVSWAELERRTARLAVRLAVDRGARVAFCLDNSVEVVEGVLATVRAAAVGVPLSSRATDAELAALLADCEPAVLVTDRRNLPRITRLTAGRALRLVVTGEGQLPDGATRFEGLVAEASAASPRDDLGLDEPAWLLYTSGTSGTPRAAVSSQRSALWSSVACYVPRLGLSATDRVLWPLPLSHTYAHSLCVLGTTVAGASARITAAPEPGELVRLVEEYAPTVLGGVPLTYRQLLDAGLGTVASLRFCVTAGAPSGPDLREQVGTRFGAPLLDGYGSTETCGKIAMEVPDGPSVRGSSGLPLPGMDVRLVDPENGREATDSAEGEIWVRGPGVMLGYHDRPEETAVALRDGWYRTGDLGRLGEDGCLTVTGRVGDRIVRGGENVDPAEVEQVLRGLPGVRDAAVVARAHPLLGEVPVAFVVPAESTLEPAGLIRACAAVLSAHKVPEEILFTPAVPRTAAGKPRRALLREALAERAAEPTLELPADRTPGERQAALTDLVCAEASAIRGSAADPGTAFADLGLTSMDAMSLWHRLSLRTGLRLPATLVWDHPNPAAVAAYLDARMRRTHQTATPMATYSTASAPVPVPVPVPATTVPQRGPHAEPVAIVAVGCRYPGGVGSPEELWRLAADGVDATGEFPTDRGWDLDALHHPDPDRIGTTYTRRGGFLDNVADFDPLFFGMSPREALATDPQHRLLLEVAWETLERAGIPAPTVRGTSTGVFVGLMHVGYGNGVSPHELESHIGIGSSGSVASGRIAYVLGLRGPVMTLDTACSSSLVAMDLAAKSLRAGECTLALAGGVTVLSSPQPFVAFSRQRALSPDGRCRSFAAGADGTAWGEGVGLVLLEKLSDARRNGHPVLAVLRGSAVNSDGASNGLTAPNGEAQRELIRLALADAGLRTADVDVVEGHGTGTALGDPIEAGALLATYGQGRDPDDPVWLGSVKSNLGHTQAAAGVAGVIKMIESMHHGELPASLYAEQPSPHVDWTAGGVRLLDRARPWPRRDRPRRAAVSSFGIGGTNAHVIIEEPSAADSGGEGGVTGAGGAATVSFGGHPGARSGAGTGAGAGAGSGAGPGTETGAGSRAASGTASGADSGAAPGTKTSAGSHTAPSTATGADSGAAPVPGPGDGAGTEPGAPSGHAAGVGPVAGSGTAPGADVPPAPNLPTTRLPVTPWLIGGGDEAGLRAHAAKLAAALADVTDESAALDVSYSLATTRAPLSRRAAVLAADAEGLLAGLRDLADGVDTPALLRGTARTRRKVALLCAGQGAQRPGMGRELRMAFPAFDAAFTGLAEEFTPLLDRPLLEVIDSPDAGLLNRTDYAQPALFAFAVALHTLLADWEVRPDYLVGHSIGELAAAHLAGVFSRADAVRLVAARGRLMAALPIGGAMIAVRAPLAEVTRHLGAASGRVAVAAVNGPTSVVLSGDEDAVTALAAAIAHPSHRLRVSHAFHSPLLDPMLEEYRAIAETVTYQRPSVPVVSTLTGRPEQDALTDAEHWVRQARETVRFADAMRWTAEEGVTAYIEAAPSASLAVAAEDCVAPDAGAVFTSCRDPRTALEALAALHVHGVPVGWRSVYAGSAARRRPLPTYPFQRQRYWLNAVRHRTPAGHPLMGEPQHDADGPGIRHTAVLSTTDHPWLADHAIGDRVVVPATLFAELACRATGTRGAVRLAELAFNEPLVLSAADRMQVQVVAGAPDQAGGRPVTIWARAVGATGPWSRHATATTAPVQAPPTDPGGTWPPAGAERIPIDYPRLAALGHHYGPAFRAVSALWRRDGEVFAELALSPGEAATADAYTLHPALFDAALHAALLAEEPGERPRQPRAPLACTGLTVYATGASAARAVVRRLGEDEFRVTLTDAVGRPLAAVESLVTRVIPTAATARAETYRLTWRPVAQIHDASPSPEHELLDVAQLAAALPEDATAPERVRELLTAVLGVVREWTSDARPGRLTVLTHNATGEDPDLAEAAVAGLVRSAQSEHPDRIVLVDRRGTPVSPKDLETALRSGEQQVCVRDGLVLAPRLTLTHPPAAEAPALDPEGTVLITGGTGALGESLARYLVVERGVRHLLLTGRSGRVPDWAGGLHAQVRVVACDVSDRAAVDALVASCRPAPTAVFHLAGVVDDGVVDTMTPDRLATVLAPKADGAWHLHEATKDLGLSAFVLYSSAAGVLGRPGQSNYAAANGFLDALAQHRVARGLPAQALAWGPWSTADDEGMAARVAPARLGEGGVLSVTEREGIRLLDAAMRLAEPVLVPIPLDLAAAGGPAAPSVLADLVAQRAARSERAVADVPRVGAVGEGDAVSATAQAPGAWRERLATIAAHERETVLAELIRIEVAAVLGFADPASLPVERAFTELGFDSLTAVQLRNRLSAFTRVRLAPTVVMEFPTLPELAAHVHAALIDAGALPHYGSEAAAQAAATAGSGAQAQGGPDSPAFRSPPSSPFRFSALYHRVLREQGALEAMGLRQLASYALPAFSDEEGPRHAVPPVRLAQGDAIPLAYIPDYLSPLHREPTNLAEQFDGERDLFLLEHPGFGTRRAVPDSMATLVRTHAETVRALPMDQAPVIVGYCAGGAVAHAVARHLAHRGHPPAGVILIDSHAGVLRRNDPRGLALMAAGAGLPDDVVDQLDDSLLITGGGYARVLENWQPEPSPVATLLLRGRPTSHMRQTAPDGDWQPQWPLPHDSTDLPGDHFSVLNRDADSTAAAIRAWLTR
ncbi:SDR family NAD(P)-dependent oxidoreductase [Streptomyces sp. NPDC012935]|uniref:SDR family NAD(P)-dependent oxidoreductase n=1 Tax=Streptomyces sp. NPDC012935 TaxID=3364857 RepID=UPI003685C51C